MYEAVKTGMRREVTLLILFIPPTMAKKVSTVKIIPKNKGDIGKREETELICTKLPVVSEFSTQNKAKITERKQARLCPIVAFKPSFM